jgi:hypothetical protein
MTLLRVSTEALAPAVKTRDTAEIETPAKSATFCAVTLLVLATVFFVDTAGQPSIEAEG